MPLLLAGALLSLLIIGSKLGIRHTAFYLVIGIFVWLCFLFSGVHATIAGVLIAFTIPANTKINEPEFVGEINNLATRFKNAIPQNGTLTTNEQHLTIEKIKQVCLDAETPLQKIEYALHPWVAFLIMPLFALSNAGMSIRGDFFNSIINPVSLGIMIGLILGKFLGVYLFTKLMVKFKLAELPKRATRNHIIGVSVLAGVGFTMSIFVTSLAFHDQPTIELSKYGIL